jgi:hypothetical protein
MRDNSFASDASYFDIVAEQTSDPDHRRQLHKVADEYRRLAKNYVPVPGQTRVEFWSVRAEKCRALSGKFPSKICSEQLSRLASAYDPDGGALRRRQGGRRCRRRGAAARRRHRLIRVPPPLIG